MSENLCFSNKLNIQKSEGLQFLYDGSVCRCYSFACAVVDLSGSKTHDSGSMHAKAGKSRPLHTTLILNHLPDNYRPFPIRILIKALKRLSASIWSN
jgi:hypothetical protein